MIDFAVALTSLTKGLEALRAIQEIDKNLDAATYKAKIAYFMNAVAEAKIALIGDRVPTRAMLDEAFPDRPAAFLSSDGHSLWVNSQALAAANIKRATPNPGAGGASVRGIIVRDAKSAEATGFWRKGPRTWCSA